MGRTASGVKGIDVGNGKCVGCEQPKMIKNSCCNRKRYGKKTNLDEYRKTHRGKRC